MNNFTPPHPDDLCYNMAIRFYENDYDDEQEQDIADFSNSEIDE